MKKYRIKFSIVNLFFKTQNEVVRLQTMWSGISAVIVSSTLINASEHYAFYAAIGCALVDKLIGCLWLEEKI